MAAASARVMAIAAERNAQVATGNALLAQLHAERKYTSC